jgi:hypothetical protein
MVTRPLSKRRPSTSFSDERAFLAIVFLGIGIVGFFLPSIREDAKLFALWLLLSFGISVALLVWATRPRWGKLENVPLLPTGGPPFGVPLPMDLARPAELRSAVTPIGTFAVYILLALIWNGYVAYLVWQAAPGWRQGLPGGFAIFFLLPAAALGAFLAVFVGRHFLVLFNPRPHLTLTPGVLETGRTSHLEWRLGSGGREVRRVNITLEGREEARANTGTDNELQHTASFLSIPVVDCNQRVEIAAGGVVTFAVPSDTVPSFRSAHNRIVWSLKVRCDLPRWPDSEETFEVVMRPGEGSR